MEGGPSDGLGHNLSCPGTAAEVERMWFQAITKPEGQMKQSRHGCARASVSNLSYCIDQELRSLVEMHAEEEMLRGSKKPISIRGS